MKNTILLFVMLLATVGATAQIFEPVNWSTSVKKISDTEYDLIITANINPGWHLYAQNVPEDGPIPTSFVFDEDGYSCVGKTKEGEGHTVYDKVFEMNIKYFDGEATFTQRVKAKKGIKIIAEVEFMVCDDTRCLPPTFEDLEFQL